jgi:D-beta-D-heptose 7-phosphate kinase/D-beta-D-heptose 1-phosphate adenosyltransferase
MVALSKALASIESRLILVVGDLIVDRYIFGLSKRISPEAPVPIVLVDREETRAGGAGNVALNLISMGARVRMVGRIGTDSSGSQLRTLLAQEGIDTSGVFEQEGFPTPAKTRIIAAAQQLLRVDHEKSFPLKAEVEQAILSSLPLLFEGVSLVAISDYAKGTLSDGLLRAVIDGACSRGIPCITDPKGTNFQKYAGSTILKPNASETLRAAPPQACGSIEEAATALLREVNVDTLMVTRSEEGISLFYPDGRHTRFPVLAKKEVRDVTGAGDTVLAMLSVAYASGLTIDEAVSLSNVAASCAVERVGCARVSLQDVASQLIAQNPSGKICSGETFFGLLAAMPRERLLMIRMPHASNLSSQQLLRLSEVASLHPGRRVVACFEEASLDPRLLNLVASLGQMNLVVHGVDANAFGSSVSSDHVVVDL